MCECVWWDSSNAGISSPLTAWRAARRGAATRQGRRAQLGAFANVGPQLRVLFKSATTARQAATTSKPPSEGSRERRWRLVPKIGPPIQRFFVGGGRVRWRKTRRAAACVERAHDGEKADQPVSCTGCLLAPAPTHCILHILLACVAYSRKSGIHPLAKDKATDFDRSSIARLFCIASYTLYSRSLGSRLDPQGCCVSYKCASQLRHQHSSPLSAGSGSITKRPAAPAVQPRPPPVTDHLGRAKGGSLNLGP